MSMGFLKLAYRSEAEIPIDRDSQKMKLFYSVFEPPGEQTKNRSR